MEKDNKKTFIIKAELIILAIWIITTNLKLINLFFLPTPQEVAISLINSLSSINIWSDLAYTLYRAFVSLVIGTIIGVPFGLLIGYFNRLYKSCEFIIEFFRATPATALFPLFLLLFGIGDIAKIALVSWSIIFIIIIHSVYGVHLSRQSRYRVAKIMKYTGFSLFKKFVFPEALPQILAGIHIALSNSLIVVVVTEMFIGTQMGLGKRIVDSQMVYKIPDMYASILLLGTTGYILNRLFNRGEKSIVHWIGK